MATSTDIVNVALRRIGATRIASLATDGSKEGIAGRDLYDPARRMLLVSHNWNFATKRVMRSSSTAAHIGTAPAFGYDYAYILPDDFLRMVSVHPDESDRGTVEYRLETQDEDDRVLMCSATSVYLKYIYDVEDVAVMSEAFRDTLAWMLARDFAAALSKSTAAAEMAEGMYRRQLSRAKSIDGVEDFPDRMATGSWATERWGRRAGDDIIS